MYILVFHVVDKQVMRRYPTECDCVFMVASLSCRSRCRTTSCCSSPTLTQSAPCGPSFRSKVSRLIDFYCSTQCGSRRGSLRVHAPPPVCCRSVLADCEGSQWIGGSVLPGCSEKRLRGDRRRQRSGLAVCGRSVQREVITHTQTWRSTELFHTSRLTSVCPPFCPAAFRMNRWSTTVTPFRRIQRITSLNSASGTDPACSLGPPAPPHNRAGDMFVTPLSPNHLPSSHTCTYTNPQRSTCRLSTSVLVTSTACSWGTQQRATCLQSAAHIS